MRLYEKNAPTVVNDSCLTVSAAAPKRNGGRFYSDLRFIALNGSAYFPLTLTSK